MTRPTTRRAFLRAVGAGTAGATASVGGCLGGGDSETTGDGEGTTTPTDGGGTTTTGAAFEFGSPAFEDGATIPRKYTCDGADRSPPLSVSAPDGAGSLAVVVDDPDAPGGTFTHWLLWNVPADRTSIPRGLPRTETLDQLGGARQGTNDFDEVGYRGPCPPSGDGAHTYRFTAYAVDGTLGLSAGSRKEALLDALDGSTVARARFTGEYERA